MKFQIKTQGFDTFVKKLKKLDGHLQTKVSRRATARAADAVRKQIKSRILFLNQKKERNYGKPRN